MKTKKKRTLEQEIDMTTFCIKIVSGCCIAISILNTANIFFDIRSIDFPEGVLAPVLSGYLATNLCLLVSGILILPVMKNIGRKEIFVQRNANMILMLGVTMEACGIFQMIVKHINLAERIAEGRDQQLIDFVTTASQGYMLHIMAGMFLLAISQIIKIGIRMREEQELTI